MHVLKSKKERITLEYGRQTLNGKPYNHTGIDIIKKVASCDWEIAIQRGKVVALVTNIKGFKSGSYGNYVMLEHGNGVRTLYAHIKYGTIKVKKGDIVEQGQVLGYMGASGNAYGAHLHFEVRVNGKQVNPKPYLEDKKKIEPYREYKVVSEEEGLWLRKGAGLKYAKIVCMPYKAKVEILDNKTTKADGYNWINVKYENYTGYCANEYLK